MTAGVFIGGCGQSSSPVPSSAPAVLTVGKLAAAGETIFAKSCAGCHGTTGGGGKAPAITGASAHLDKYNTAQGLLDFVDTTMPANAPGSLSHQDYLDVVSYLLVQNNDVSADTTFDESQLSNIALK
jgi:polar amino acid transport system substrate-binding protein